jgi:integrase
MFGGEGFSRVRFHDLRRTSATSMLNHDVPVIIVSRRLGHARTSITTDVYGHLLPNMQDVAAELIDELVTPITLRSIAPELHPDQ